MEPPSDRSYYTTSFTGEEPGDSILPLKWRCLDLEVLEVAAPDFPGLSLLRHIARVGASVGYKGDRSAVLNVPNGPSLKKYPRAWKAQVLKDLGLGRLVVPAEVGMVVVKNPALHVILKSHPEIRTLDDLIRLIYDATCHNHPDALNAKMPLEPPAPMHRYMTLHRLKRRLGWYLRKFGIFYMAISDAKAAFRRIRVRLADWPLMGLDTGLPGLGLLLSTVLTFGLRSSPRSWVTLEDGIIWALRAAGVDAGAYVDDAYVLAATYWQCLQGMKRCVHLHDATGCPACRTKLADGGFPDTKQEYTGVIWSAMPPNLGSMYFSEKKIKKYTEQLRRVATQRRLPATEVATVKGRLAHACTVYEQAKPWTACWHRVDTTNSTSTITVTRDMARCAKFVATVLTDRVGCNIVEPTPHRVHIYTDASTTTGFGGHMGPHHFYGEWTKDELLLNHIFLYELFTVVLAVVVFGDLIQGKRVTLHCDNQAVVACVRANKAPKVAGGDWLLQTLTRHLIRLHARLHIVWIGTKENICADDLSRGRVPATLPLLSYVHGTVVQTQTSWRRRTPWRARALVWDRWRRYSSSHVLSARG